MAEEQVVLEDSLDVAVGEDAGELAADRLPPRPLRNARS